MDLSFHALIGKAVSSVNYGFDALGRLSTQIIFDDDSRLAIYEGHGTSDMTLQVATLPKPRTTSDADHKDVLQGKS